MIKVASVEKFLSFTCFSYIFGEVAKVQRVAPRVPGGWGHFNFVCTGVCGHITEKFAHSQTEAGPSISKNRAIPRLCTIKHEPKLAEVH